jgi:hypothetical protein
VGRTTRDEKHEPALHGSSLPDSISVRVPDIDRSRSAARKRSCIERTPPRSPRRRCHTVRRSPPASGRRPAAGLDRRRDGTTRTGPPCR